MELKRFIGRSENKYQDKIILNDSEHNHLSNVLRMKIGENIIVLLDDEYDYVCEIESISKKQTELKILEKVKNNNNPKVNVTVFQAILKGDNMSLVVQKLTELGVRKFVPITSKNITALGNKNMVEKLSIVSNQSIKQCKRSIAMQISKTTDIKAIVNDFNQYDLVFVAYEKEKINTMQSIFGKVKNLKNVALIIGSEGGFTDEEIKMLVNNGAKSITMGKRILRAETASIALTATTMLLLGEWDA